MSRVVVTTLSLMAAAVVTAPVAAAEEPAADVRVDVSAPRHILPPDGWSTLTTTVSNTGDAPASDVRLVITLPSNLHSSSTSTSNEWDCSAPSGWPLVLTCDHVGDLAAGATAYPVILSVYPYEATAGDAIDADATVTTTSQESDTSDNAAVGRLTIVGKGAIRGQVWYDLNANGVREQGEPAPGGSWGIEVAFDSVDDEDLYGVANANNGPFYFSVPAKKFSARVTVNRAEWAFTTPDVGDDTTDSDVTQVSESTWYRIARSPEFTVPAGGTVTLDIGLVAVS